MIKTAVKFHHYSKYKNEVVSATVGFVHVQTMKILEFGSCRALELNHIVL